MRRRWIADEWDRNSAALLGAQAEHLARVLRAQVGQEFDIVAGDIVRRGVIEQVENEVVRFSLHEKLDAAETLPLVVALGIVRFECMEWAIEKLTELGVAQIVPLRAERSEKHLVQAAEKRVERWRRIALEAAQQSRRGDVPEISDPTAATRWLEEQGAGPRLLLSENERVRSLREWLEAHSHSASDAKRIRAAIGPEGGWTEREFAAFTAHGWQSVSLGPRILRTETAAIAVASIVGAYRQPFQ